MPNQEENQFAPRSSAFDKEEAESFTKLAVRLVSASRLKDKVELLCSEKEAPVQPLKA